MTTITIKTGNISLQITESDIVITMGDQVKSVKEVVEKLPLEQKHEAVHGPEPGYKPMKRLKYSAFKEVEPVAQSEPGKVNNGFLTRKVVGQGTCISCGRTFDKRRKDQKKCCLPDCRDKKAMDHFDDTPGEEI